MLRRMYKFTKIIAVIVSIIIVTACAAPVTKTGSLSKEELKQERQAQQELALKTLPKKLERKYKDLSIYQTRLNRVAEPLAKAAKQLCNTGKCTYKFKVVEQGGLNAWTDGKAVMFTPMMMDFLESDKELALVIAHELSHNVMDHHHKKTQNLVVGSVLDLVAAVHGVNTMGLFGNIGGISYSQGFENEADYVGIYVMALAGYDVSNVHHIWRKMTTQTGTGTSNNFFGSHPSNPERFIRMKRAIIEVQAKQKAGQKLIPNYKT